LDLSEVGVGVEMGKLILDKAAQAGKAVVERCAKVIELDQHKHRSNRWHRRVAFRRPFVLYFYVTQREVVSGYGKVNLPFLYAEFRPFDYPFFSLSMPGGATPLRWTSATSPLWGRPMTATCP